MAVPLVVRVTKTDIHFWKIATIWRQEANLWREVASKMLNIKVCRGTVEDRATICSE
jgi:hypothetical protein